jgi:hypothetical protein
MAALVIPVSPLSLNQLTRDYWGQFDPAIIAQLAELASDPCYQIKFYKAPADNQEVLAPLGYVTYGLQITPGSIIFGIYSPAVVNTGTPTASIPGKYTIQMTDVSLQHKFWDSPVSSLLLSNFKPTFQANVTNASPGPGGTNMGSFPNLFCAPHPVVGSGLFDIEIQETSNAQQRIQFILGVLEVCRGS